MCILASGIFVSQVDHEFRSTDKISDVKDVFRKILGHRPMSIWYIVDPAPFGLSDDRQTLAYYGVKQGALLSLFVKIDTDSLKLKACSHQQHLDWQRELLGDETDEEQWSSESETEEEQTSSDRN